MPKVTQFSCDKAMLRTQVFFGGSMRASQVALVVKNPPANAGDARDMGLIPGLGGSPRERNGNPLQYPCLENPMDRGAWQTTVHGVTRVGHDLAVKKREKRIASYLV